MRDLSRHPVPGFAKLSTATGASAQFTAELAGLRLLHRLAGVTVPVPVAHGVCPVPPGAHLLLSEALPERLPGARTPADWRSIGRALATLHAVPGPAFGLDTNGYFGPLRQDNAPVHPDSWTIFYAERRLLPHLRLATDSGHLPAALAAGIERIIARLPALAGPEARPALRELWRLYAYLAVLSAAGGTPFGRQFLTRIDQAVPTTASRARAPIRDGQQVNGVWQSMTAVHEWVAFKSLDAWIPGE